MVAENKRNHLVELKHCIQTPYEKASEGIEFLQILKDYLVILHFYCVVFAEHGQEIIQLQLLAFFVRFVEFLINLLYNTVGYHSSVI